MMREIDKLLPNELRKRCFQLEAELDDAKATILQIHKDLGCELFDPNGTIWEHAGKVQSENAEFKRQFAAGELLTPQTIHSFLESKHDRWNPLYMADLVKFAAELARKDAQ
jgi:hypothetical protein